MRASVVLFTLCLFFKLSFAVHSTMSLVTLNVEGAVCNDGSPAGYYWKAGNTDKWIVHFQGGGYCWDETSCAQRYKTAPQLMSSKPFTPTFTIGGLFDDNSTANPDWYDATYVYIPYCTSDSHSGNVSASNKTFGWEFKGKVVIQAIIQTTLPQGLDSASTVLVSGCSAGGTGVLSNVDFIGSLLPPLPNRNFRGHTDAGFFLYATPFVPVYPDFQELYQISLPLWGGIPNAKCASALGADAWKCYMGQFALSFIKTPILVHQETEDAVQLAWDGLLTPPQFANETLYVNDFRANMTLALAATRPPHAVYAPACYTHCISEGDPFFIISINNTLTDQAALHSFFQDSCDGFSCSQGCPAV